MAHFQMVVTIAIPYLIWAVQKPYGCRVVFENESNKVLATLILVT